MPINSTEDNAVANLFPVGMQSSEISLQDEDGNSIVTEFEELSSSGSEQAIVPSAINVESSTDVIIGPVTQFNGTVTIYQNVNGTSQAIRDACPENPQSPQNEKSEKSDKASHEACHKPSKSNKAIWSYSKYLKYVGVPIIILLLIAMITTVLILFYPTENPIHLDKNDADPSRSDDPDDNSTLGPVGPGIIIDKKTWGGAPALSSIPLKHPTHYVIICHTATPFCDSFKKCSARVLSIQQHHVGTNNSPDIGYNFLIGGDGNAYEGRGWDRRNFNAPDSISISFIGNYLYDNLTSGMIKVAQKLLAEGVLNGKLAENYTLICHNQTYATQSPGPNIYDVVSTWPHFVAGSFKEKIT